MPDAVNCVQHRGGESSWYDTLWRLVRGGIGGENSELQLVHLVLTVSFFAIFLPFLPISTNISENENI